MARLAGQRRPISRMAARRMGEKARNASSPFDMSSLRSALRVARWVAGAGAIGHGVGERVRHAENLGSFLELLGVAFVKW
ncbi:hypothetical protein D3C85_1620730 [compost metagenome]